MYGISSDKIEALQINSFCSNKKVIEIPCSIRKDLHINIELPYTLAIQISDYKDKISNSQTTTIFRKETDKKINSSFLSTILKKIKYSYYEKQEVDNSLNPFTPTGLQKYAIIKMIEAGINQSIIMDFTGQSQDIFNDCQFIVDENKQLNRNRYINHMIRGISTYDIV